MYKKYKIKAVGIESKISENILATKEFPFINV